MGRKPGTSQSEQLLRGEIAKALSKAIGDKRGAMSEAANQLGITKQALSLYMRQKATPGAEVLRRICKHWNLHLNVKGALIDAESLPEQVQSSEPEQLSLFAALTLVQDQKLEVTILERHDRAIDLKVTINFEEILVAALSPRAPASA